MYKDLKRKSQISKILIDKTREVEVEVGGGVRVVRVGRGQVVVNVVVGGQVVEVEVVEAEQVWQLVLQQVVGALVGVVTKKRKREQKTKNVSSLRKFELISLPKDYVGELQALEKRLQRSGLPRNRIKQIMRKNKRDMCRGYLKCQIVNWLDNTKNQIMQYWISK